MRLTIVGRNADALGSECVIFGEIDPRDYRFLPAPAAALAASAGWRSRPMRPGAGLGEAPALVGAGEREDHCRIRGRLVLVSHRWSGVLQINDIGRKYVVDLYGEATRLVLLDILNEILIDVTALASRGDGGLALPALSGEALARHIAQARPWFRFLERDPDFAPGLLRGAVERWRRPPDERLKRRLMALLLPALLAPPPAPAREEAGLRDELGLLAAAVEGLALRARAGA